MADEPRRAPIRSYRDLEVWQRAVTLVVEVYALTRRFPSDERFGLTSQLRRASVSVASNIAEGHARSGPRDYNRFVAIARGSLAEVETQLLIAQQLDFAPADGFTTARMIAEQVGQMLTRLHERLGRHDPH